LLAALTLGAAALLGIETLVFTVLVSPTAASWWFLGVFHALVVAAFLHVTQLAFLAHDPDAVRLLRGAWGEDNTRSELQRAKRRRLVWGWVDSITLQAGDLDHFVLTRRGGLIVIDSKWRNRATDTIDMARAAHRARLRAEALADSVLPRERRARHRSNVRPLRVTPVVVLWGAAQHGVPERAHVDGIEFVAGRHLLAWLRQLDGQPISKNAAHDILERLERYRAFAWKSAAAAKR
jgi:hypothetical protein